MKVKGGEDYQQSQGLQRNQERKIYNFQVPQAFRSTLEGGLMSKWLKSNAHSSPAMYSPSNRKTLKIRRCSHGVPRNKKGTRSCPHEQYMCLCWSAKFKATRNKYAVNIHYPHNTRLGKHTWDAGNTQQSPSKITLHPT